MKENIWGRKTFGYEEDLIEGKHLGEGNIWRKTFDEERFN